MAKGEEGWGDCRDATNVLRACDIQNAKWVVEFFFRTNPYWDDGRGISVIVSSC